MDTHGGNKSTSTSEGTQSSSTAANRAYRGGNNEDKDKGVSTIFISELCREHSHLHEDVDSENDVPLRPSRRSVRRERDSPIETPYLLVSVLVHIVLLEPIPMSPSDLLLRRRRYSRPHHRLSVAIPIMKRTMPR